MTDQLTELSQALSKKSEECESLQKQTRKLSFKLSQLEFQLKEANLKNEDCRRLPRARSTVAEKVDLQRIKDQALVEATEKVQARFDEEIFAAIEAERVKWLSDQRDTIQAMQRQFEDQIRLTDEARQEVHEVCAKHEAESNKILGMQGIDNAKHEYEAVAKSDVSVCTSTEWMQDMIKAAVVDERVKWQKEWMKLQEDHIVSIRALQLQLADTQTTIEAIEKEAQLENERTLSHEKERYRAEVEHLLAEHKDSIEAMQKEFEGKIQEQERLTEEARRELQESNDKQLGFANQFNVDAGLTVDEVVSTDKMDASTETEAPPAINNSCTTSQNDGLLDSVQLRTSAPSIERQLTETRRKLKNSSEYAGDLHRYSVETEEVNVGLYRQLQAHKNQIEKMSEVADELQEKFVAEARRAAKLETKLTKLRQENSELQARDAMLRLAQVSDVTQIACLNRQLEEENHRLNQAKQTAELAKNELEEARLEVEMLTAERREMKRYAMMAQRESET